MKGNITKLGKQRYRIRIFLGRDENEKQRFYSEIVNNSREAADDRLRDLVREYAGGGQLPTKKLKQDRQRPLDDLFNEWLKAQVQVSKRTHALYTMYLKEYIRPYIGKVRLDQLTDEQAQDLVHTLTDRDLSSSTVRYAIVVLSAALGYAVKKKYIPRNPVDLRKSSRTVQLPDLKRKPRVTLNVEQARIFIAAARAHRWGTLFIVAILSGMRPGELQGLKWDDVDWDTETVFVKRALEWPTPKQWEIGPPKTEAGIRNVLLPPNVMELLRQHRERQDVERKKLGKRYEEHNFIFANERGGPFNGKNVIRRDLRPLLKAAGLPDTMTLYELRHSCATVDMMLGTPPKVVSEKLGHRDPGFTLKTYSHVKPSMQREAVNRAAAALFSDEKATVDT